MRRKLAGFGKSENSLGSPERSAHKLFNAKKPKLNLACPEREGVCVADGRVDIGKFDIVQNQKSNTKV